MIIEVHYKFVLYGLTINWKVFAKNSKVGPGFFYHDNVPVHSMVLICKFLADKKIPAVLYPPYSPDLALWDFFFSLD
ncbi:protein GVQW3-like [Aphis craccivora]|uniref:Protein GVQW3-like n=1 Tax=Aphis craccivora TaxID=307492 RepID=A0A6G0YCI8_APHCR|nr:protein GVQW3-like [Aphis craccivora]